jgi:hypothetical protein
VTNETMTDRITDTTEQLAGKAKDAIATVGSSSLSRRRFLVTAGAVGVGLGAAACGSDDDKGDTATTDTTGKSSTTMGDSSGGDGAGDLEVAKVAAGLEVLAVATYKAAGDAAGAGKLGAVPPAVGEYVKTAMGHHQEHLDAWNKVITGAGEKAVSEPNAKLKPTVDAEFAKVTDVAGAAKLALMLEQIAAQTYLKVLPTLKSKDAIKLAGSIQAVDQQHQAILLFALGQYPVPDTFQKTDMAAV